MKIVVIKWQDAQSEDSWIDLESVRPELADIITVGLLIKESKTVYSVALNYDSTNKKYSCLMSIPKKWVTSYAEIRKKI